MSLSTNHGLSIDYVYAIILTLLPLWGCGNINVAPDYKVVVGDSKYETELQGHGEVLVPPSVRAISVYEGFILVEKDSLWGTEIAQGYAEYYIFKILSSSDFKRDWRNGLLGVYQNRSAFDSACKVFSIRGPVWKRIEF
jgi:hypothetical protein